MGPDKIAYDYRFIYPEDNMLRQFNQVLYLDVRFRFRYTYLHDYKRRFAKYIWQRSCSLYQTRAWFASGTAQAVFRDLFVCGIIESGYKFAVSVIGSRLTSFNRHEIHRDIQSPERMKSEETPMTNYTSSYGEFVNRNVRPKGPRKDSC